MHQNKKFKAYNFEQSLNRGTKIEYNKKVVTKKSTGEGRGVGWKVILCHVCPVAEACEKKLLVFST